MATDFAGPEGECQPQSKVCAEAENSAVPRYGFGMSRTTARDIAVHAVYRETEVRNTALLNLGVVSFALP